jgi:putative hydroxymethylpyrimidine transport system ATP-binding protein
MLEKRTVLLVTHDPAEAARLGHHIRIMTETGLIKQQTPTTPPIRDFDAPETIEAQISLMQKLRAD